MKKTTVKNHAPADKPKAQPDAEQPQQTVVKKPHSSKPRYLELSEAQLKACDLASDLIMNGGSHGDAELLMQVLLRHEWTIRFHDERDVERRQKDAAQFAAKWAPREVQKLMRHWPEEPTDAPQPKATSVTEMARENARESLRWVFGDFLGAASPENVYYLREVLERTFSDGGSLAQSFADETGLDHTYVPIRYGHLETVKQFIALLPEPKKQEAA